MQNKNTLALPEMVDVLVVGNGPVGATLAALLGRYGVQALVVDKIHDVLLMPRAIALDNEALRILQLAGLDEEAFEKISKYALSPAKSRAFIEQIAKEIPEDD